MTEVIGDPHTPGATRDSYPLTMVDVAELIRNDGRLWPYWSAVTCLAVCWAESGGDAFARPVVLNPGNPAHLSQDVGLMQINTYWHDGIEVRDLLDPQTNMTYAIDVALRGQLVWRPNWTWWVAFNAKAHVQHVGAARHAINRVRESHNEMPL